MKASFADDYEPLREQTIQAIQHAIDRGVKLLDTADIYAPTWNMMGHNELILEEAIRTHPNAPQDLVIATKGGITRSVGEVWSRNANLDYLTRAVEASAKRLNVQSIPLWQHHRLDPKLAFETQLENLATLKQNKLIENIGVSNYSAKQLKRAIDVIGPIASVQNQLNPAYRQELDVLEVCEANNITYIPWSPTKGARGESASPLIKELAEKYQSSTYAIAIAWLRQLSTKIVPIPGVSRIESVDDALRALNLRLEQEDIERISQEPTLPMDKELLSDQPAN